MNATAKPIEKLQSNTCGTCVYHLPNTDSDVEVIKQGKGVGKSAYWVCMCKNATNYKKGRICEDGNTCKHWENRYKNKNSLDEWIQCTCYGENN